MLTKTTPLSMLPATHFANCNHEVALRIALLEPRVSALVDVLTEVVEDSKNRVQKR